MAPKSVSGRVVKTGKSRPSSSQRKVDLGALGAADPVALHRDHVLGPGLELLEVGEQALGVVGDLEEPLLELALHDLGAAALAAAVDDLLVGEHGGVLGAPLDRRLGPVGEAVLEQPQEDPLGPAVVLGRVGRQFARPVDRDPPLAELALEGCDRALGRHPRRLAGFDRVVLRRQAEGVVAHRVDHLEAVAAAEVGDRVADRVALEMADVGFARRGRAASPARRTSASSHRSRAGRGWRPPRSSPRPRPAATCARLPWGRSCAMRPSYEEPISEHRHLILCERRRYGDSHRPRTRSGGGGG